MIDVGPLAAFVVVVSLVRVDCIFDLVGLLDVAALHCYTSGVV